MILGAEARGFIFGGALAYALGCGFVTARKPGKLPWQTIEARYDLEYGTDALEVHVDSIVTGQRVVVLDDVLATGGTARAKIELVERLGGIVVGALFVIELAFLNGRDARRHRRARADHVQLTRGGYARRRTACPVQGVGILRVT